MTRRTMPISKLSTRRCIMVKAYNIVDEDCYDKTYQSRIIAQILPTGLIPCRSAQTEGKTLNVLVGAPFSLSESSRTSLVLQLVAG